MDYAEMKFPKPGDVEREPEPVHIYPDGREICNKLTAAGKREYRRRVGVMVARQNCRCCLEGFIPECTGYLKSSEALFEHENGRGGGKQDDRIELPDGRRINGAAHALCNQIKGSRRFPYNAAYNSAISAPAGL